MYLYLNLGKRIDYIKIMKIEFKKIYFLIYVMRGIHLKNTRYSNCKLYFILNLLLNRKI